VSVSLQALLFTPAQANTAPTLNPIANMTVSEGMTADQTLTGSDPEGDPLTFTKASGPGFMMVTPTAPSPSGTVHLQPQYTDAGLYPASASVSDGTLSDTKSFQITVNNVNQGPIMGAVADVTVNEGATADKVITATDPDGNAMTFSKVAGPTFVTVVTTSAGTGTGTGNAHLAPGFQEASCTTQLVAYTVTVRATDNGNPNMTSDTSFMVTVRNVDRAPTANIGVPSTTVCLGQAVNFNGSASSDPDGDPLTFSWNFGDGSPPGTGPTISHTYANPGTYTVTLTVTDNCTRANTASASVTVSACQATISRCPSSPAVNLNSSNDGCVYIEPVAACFNASDISGPTVVMKYLSSSITASSVGPPGDDCTLNNGVQDSKACFSKADLNILFASLTAGTTTSVTVDVEGSTTAGCHFTGSITFDVKKP